MIVVNGMEYRTLEQDLYANGKKVVEARCNGNLVYPEREDTSLLKVVGHINTIVSHDHAGENPSCTSNDRMSYTYHDGDNYRAKGCFSLVVRNHSYNWPSQQTKLMFQQTVRTIPAAKWPLNGSYNSKSSYGDIYGPGNAWVVYLYSGSTAPMLPTAGDGIHPLLGSDAIETHALYKDGKLIRARFSVELLLHLDVSAPRICPWSSDKLYIGLGYPYLDATATPLKPYLDELPANVNGLYRLNAYRQDTYFGIDWQVKGALGKYFRVALSVGSSKASGVFSTHLKIATGQSKTSSGSYDVPYLITATKDGVHREFEQTYTQGFKILNIPITQLLYSGKESTAPEEHLHPRVEDLEAFM